MVQYGKASRKEAFTMLYMFIKSGKPEDNSYMKESLKEEGYSYVGERNFVEIGFPEKYIVMAKPENASETLSLLLLSVSDSSILKEFYLCFKNGEVL